MSFHLSGVDFHQEDLQAHMAHLLVNAPKGVSCELRLLCPKLCKGSEKVCQKLLNASGHCCRCRVPLYLPWVSRQIVSTQGKNQHKHRLFQSGFLADIPDPYLRPDAQGSKSFSPSPGPQETTFLWWGHPWLSFSQKELGLDFLAPNCRPIPPPR